MWCNMRYLVEGIGYRDTPFWVFKITFFQFEVYGKACVVMSEMTFNSKQKAIDAGHQLVELIKGERIS